MEIFVQNIRTGKFYAGGDQWTLQPDDAYAFASAIAAMNFSEAQRTKNDLIMHFQSPFGIGYSLSEMARRQPVTNDMIWKGCFPMQQPALLATRER